MYMVTNGVSQQCIGIYDNWATSNYWKIILTNTAILNLLYHIKQQSTRFIQSYIQIIIIHTKIVQGKWLDFEG